MNAGLPNNSPEPIEHVTFPSTAGIPAGDLTIGVAWYSGRSNGGDSVPAAILVKRSGGVQERHDIIVPRPRAWREAPVYYFKIPVR
jgi:hypothetical protein